MKLRKLKRRYKKFCVWLFESRVSKHAPIPQFFVLLSIILVPNFLSIAFLNEEYLNVLVPIWIMVSSYWCVFTMKKERTEKWSEEFENETSLKEFYEEL